MGMRIKHLIKENQRSKAALLAKACSEFPEFEGKGHFKQMYLVSLSSVAEQEPLMEEVYFFSLDIKCEMTFQKLSLYDFRVG